MCGVSECDRGSSTMRRPWPTGGLLRHAKNMVVFIHFRFLPHFSCLAVFILHDRYDDNYCQNYVINKDVLKSRQST